MNRLHDALETCLSALEQGQSIDAALAQFPDLEDELRPLMEAAGAARRARIVDAPADFKAVGRAKFLQAAGRMRERRRPRPRSIAAVPRLAISLGLVAVLVLTSTGLVSASSGALPGDQLYGIKRSWEDVRLMLVFQPRDRTQLESDFEQERLDEIDGLIARRQAARITFSGLLTQQQDGSWVVSGIPVAVGPLTALPAGGIAEGAPVLITGATRSDGVVEASSVQMLQPGASLPPLEPSENEHEGESQAPQPQMPTSATPAAPVQPGTRPDATWVNEHSYEFTGVVESMGAQVWRINGQTVYLDQAAIIGSVKVGTIVKFEGYYSADGLFVATKIEADSPSIRSGSGNNGGSDSGSENPPSDGGSDDGSGDGGSSSTDH